MRTVTLLSCLLLNGSIVFAQGLVAPAPVVPAPVAPVAVPANTSRLAANATEFTHNRILYFAGANFDFGEQKSASVVHHFNLFFQDIDDTRFSVNTGIVRIRYSALDTFDFSNSLRKENVTLDPLRPPKDSGDKYLKRLSNYGQSLRRTDWSFYIQPMLRLTPEGNHFIAWLHGHAELIASNWVGTLTRTTVAQDTFTLNKGEQLVYNSGLEGINRDLNELRLYGYFGGGITARITADDDDLFFFQTTIGATNDRPNVTASELVSSGTIASNGGWDSFYLIRAYYLHKITGQAAGIIGFDARGILPDYQPRYAAYIGATIDLTTIFR